MDPRKWLTDPKNEGEAKVGDDDTIKITGGVDVAKLLDDVNTALGKAVVARPQARRRRCRRSSPTSSASRCSTRSRTRAWRSTPARTTRSCAGWSSTSASRTPRASTSGTSRSTSRSPTSTRTRTSPSRRTPSRSTSCSGQLGGLGLGAGGAAGSGSGAGCGGGGGASADDLEKYSKCIDRGGRRRREGAQVRRAPLRAERHAVVHGPAAPAPASLRSRPHDRRSARERVQPAPLPASAAPAGRTCSSRSSRSRSCSSSRTRRRASSSSPRRSA